jgi:hypothetical protein
MLSLALVVVLSQQGPKVIELKKPVPVPVLRQENVVRPAKSKTVTQAGAVPKVEAAAANATTSTTAAAAPDPKDDQLKDQERRQQELLKRAAANEELFRSAANALAGE